MGFAISTLFICIGFIYAGAVGYRLGRQYEANRIGRLLGSHLDTLDDNAKLQLLAAIAVATQDERTGG